MSEDVGKTRVEALYNNSIPQFNIADSYSQNSIWYLLVFKPYNDSYARRYSWYADKGLQHVQRKLNKFCKGKFLITRETIADKVHINALISCEKDLTEWHERATKDYKVYAQPVIDRRKAYEYITKEAHIRKFIMYTDYIVQDATQINSPN